MRCFFFVESVEFVECQSLEFDWLSRHESQECLARFSRLDFDPGPSILDFERLIDQQSKVYVTTSACM